MAVYRISPSSVSVSEGKGVLTENGGLKIVCIWCLEWAILLRIVVLIWLLISIHGCEVYFIFILRQSRLLIIIISAAQFIVFYIIKLFVEVGKIDTKGFSIITILVDFACLSFVKMIALLFIAVM